MKSIFRRVRHRARSWFGRDLYIPREINPTVEYHGTAAGGWSILAGSINANSILYSIGIGEDASFDLSLIAKYGCNIYAFDPTPKALKWASKNCEDKRFILSPVALAAYDGSLPLFLPKNPDFVSASLQKTELTSDQSFDAPCNRLETLMKDRGHVHLDVLKMDIEGAEYAVIAECVASGTLNKVGQLLIEFHHWVPQIGMDPSRKALNQLRSLGFRVAWVSPMGYEVLFTRDTRGQ